MEIRPTEMAVPPPAPSKPLSTATIPPRLESAAAACPIATSAPTPQRASPAALDTLLPADFAPSIAWLWPTALLASTTSPATPLSVSPAKLDIQYPEIPVYLLAETAFGCLLRAAMTETLTQLTVAHPHALFSPPSTALTTIQPTEPVFVHTALVTARSAAMPRHAVPATLVTPTTPPALETVRRSPSASHATTTPLPHQLRA